MKTTLTGGLLLLGASLVFAQTLQPGSKAPDFTLRDLSGNPVKYSSLKGDITVVTFVATKCPISNDYNTRMNALYKDYSGKGVKFVFINSNSTEPAAEVEQHAKANFNFTVYKDPDNIVADMFGAQVTPEVFVFDKDGILRYHGAIDDSRNESKVTTKSLRAALDAMLSGQAVTTAQTKAFGCTIKRTKKTT
jgi:peroxiredoxin